MSAHTPGPWKAEGHGVSAHHAAKDQRLEYWICERVGGDGRPDATQGRPTDNARLIAAAPALLYELAELVQRVEQMRLPDGSKPCTAYARYAIDKATGEVE